MIRKEERMTIRVNVMDYMSVQSSWLMYIVVRPGSVLRS